MAVGLAAASLIAGVGGQIYMGKKQKEAQEEAQARQERAQKIAKSSAASQRKEARSNEKKMRKKKPNIAAIHARQQQKRMAGETFLTPKGSSMLGQTRYLS